MNFGYVYMDFWRASYQRTAVLADVLHGHSLREQHRFFLVLIIVSFSA